MGTNDHMFDDPLSYVEGDWERGWDESHIEPINGVLRKTEKAVLLKTDAGEIWIPLSQLEYADSVNGEAVMSEWIADEKGLL